METKTETQFTPAPWFWPLGNVLASHPTEDPDAEWVIVAGFAEGPISRSLSPADAALIKAAPDLYEALADALVAEKVAGRKWFTASQYERITSVLARARGEVQP